MHFHIFVKLTYKFGVISVSFAADEIDKIRGMSGSGDGLIGVIVVAPNDRCFLLNLNALKPERKLLFINSSKSFNQ